VVRGTDISTNISTNAADKCAYTCTNHCANYICSDVHAKRCTQHIADVGALERTNRCTNICTDDLRVRSRSQGYRAGSAKSLHSMRTWSIFEFSEQLCSHLRGGVHCGKMAGRFVYRQR
jgi:hypothetical protein